MEKQLATQENGKAVRFQKTQFDFTPKSMQEALDLAKLLADSDLVPIAYKGKPGNIIVAMNYGADLGLSGVQSVNSIAVINGKPSIYGDLGKALLLSHGCSIEDFDTPQVQKEGKAWCKVTRPDGRSMERTFTVEDAKKAGLWMKPGPWTTYPYRQMQWRAFWFVARDLCADLLKGLNGAEEVQDYEIKPAKPAVSMPTLKVNPPKQIESNFRTMEVKPEDLYPQTEETSVNLAVSATAVNLGEKPVDETIELNLLGAGIRGYTSNGSFSAKLTLADDFVYTVKNQELAKQIKEGCNVGAKLKAVVNGSEIISGEILPSVVAEE